jgi:hypothetical protein
MPCRETVALCENHTERTNTVRTSQETHYVSATKPTVAVYCENHTEHTNTVRTSQETHHISATESTRLTQFKETVAVYCDNRIEHTNTVRISRETHHISATEINWLKLLRKQSLFIATIIRNTQIHSVAKMQISWRL